MLRPGGLCIAGFDWVMTSAARYTVYRREDGGLTPVEFAFSVREGPGYRVKPTMPVGR
jgi:hypothetical protein